MNVRIANKLPQVLTVSVKNGAGQVVELKLAPNAVSDPYDQSQITDYTKGLAAKGHVKIRPA